MKRANSTDIVCDCEPATKRLALADQDGVAALLSLSSAAPFASPATTFAPFLDLLPELQHKIVTKHCDAATRHSFFLTCRAFWSGTGNGDTAPCYARDKDPGADIGRAVMRHGYLDLCHMFRPLFSCYMDRCTAIIHRHYELASQTSEQGCMDHSHFSTRHLNKIAIAATMSDVAWRLACQNAVWDTRAIAGERATDATIPDAFTRVLLAPRHEIATPEAFGRYACCTVSLKMLEDALVGLIYRDDAEEILSAPCPPGQRWTRHGRGQNRIVADVQRIVPHVFRVSRPERIHLLFTESEIDQVFTAIPGDPVLLPTWLTMALQGDRSHGSPSVAWLNKNYPHIITRGRVIPSRQLGAADYSLFCLMDARFKFAMPDLCAPLDVTPCPNFQRLATEGCMTVADYMGTMMRYHDINISQTHYKAVHRAFSSFVAHFPALLARQTAESVASLKAMDLLASALPTVLVPNVPPPPRRDGIGALVKICASPAVTLSQAAAFLDVLPPHIVKECLADWNSIVPISRPYVRLLRAIARTKNPGCDIPRELYAHLFHALYTDAYNRYIHRDGLLTVVTGRFLAPVKQDGAPDQLRSLLNSHEKIACYKKMVDHFKAIGTHPHLLENETNQEPEWEQFNETLFTQ